MSGREIRTSFLEFFRDRGHAVLPSAPLIPEGDPTLLFTSAGMVPFKPYYLEGANPPNRRVATVQKCLRAGGKASDLELVGMTGRHQSFFEMLGNFSFGDYFKEEAIAWAWEYVRDVIDLPREKLWVSVFRDDDEAVEIWTKKVGLPAGRIVRLGEKDNFWGPAGASGVCGPCSEIYLDRGASYGCGKADCAPGCDCERFLEFWNLVFPQFYQDEEGNRRRLARPGIDTGMGLERVTSLVQGVEDNFSTDIFQPVTSFIRDLLGSAAGGDAARARRGDREESLRTTRLIADHARTLSFAVADGILPGNEGRGYVLRRILRRAVRRGHRLGLEEPFLHRVAGVVVESMATDYPELGSHREQIAMAVKSEEERFFRTLEQGETLFAESLARAKSSGTGMIPGGDVFRMYDTYGFPPELTREMAEEEGFGVDEAGFESEMNQQRERARRASGFKDRAAEIEQAGRAVATPFLGYESTSAEGRVVEVRAAGGVTRAAGEGAEIAIVLDRTPFYAESGGQVGDTGVIRGKDWTIEVLDTRRDPAGPTLHQGRVVSGEVSGGAEAFAEVDRDRRAAIQRNHTATHLLHAALHEVLGTHARQQGSLVAPDRLRFDFSHFAPLTEDERRAIEERVNEDVIANLGVRTQLTSYQEAKALGAMAFFGEKYGDVVRMIEIGERSRELCGGTHVGASGEIGPFVLVSEGGVAAGVRRIEAFTGRGALANLGERVRALESAAGLLRTPWDALPARIEKLLEEWKEKDRELQKLRGAAIEGEVSSLADRAVEVAGVRVVAAALPGEVDKDELRSAADAVRKSLGRGVVVLGGTREGRVLLVAGVSPDLVKEGRLAAGKLVGEVARRVGGGGGGRPDFAEAGGKDPSKLGEAMAAVPAMVAEALG